ncbi:MAG: DUF4340 domain-containing protein [Verrucomicrobiota bacterium]|nr:DUF4340 domain-containing protein [Verrucomicrobiota bacterium]
MKPRTTLALLAIAVALGAYIKFYESKRPNTEEAQRRAGQVVNLERDKLEGIVIQNGDDKIELRKDGEKWRLEAPVKDQADASAVQTLISDLDFWQKDDTISSKEVDTAKLQEFDLAKPKLRLRLLGKDAPPEILFGKDAALENRMYVRFANSRDIFVARNSVKNDISKKPEEFRDRKLTDLTTLQVSRVLLKTPAGEMELEKQGDAWSIVKPLRARADTQKVSDLISQVTGARVTQFVADDRGDLQPYALTQPRGSITLFKQDDKEGQLLQIGGGSEKDKDQVYVRFAPRSYVYTLPKKIEDLLKTTPADLRDRHLVRIDSNSLDRLTIDAPGRAKTVLARKDQSWTLASKNNQPANASEVTRLIDTLKNEQVTRFVDDVASDLPKYGLDKPQLIVTLSAFASENTAESTAGEKPLATISFGKVEGDEVFARVGEEPFIVAVKRALLDKIWSDPVQWQELAIFKFKPDEVHRLNVVTDREAALVRGPNNEWVRASGDEPINPTNVQSLLNTLTKLRAVRWIAGPPPPQAFDKTQVTITFTTSADDKAMHKLIVGGPAGDGMWFARVEGRDGIAVISNPDFNALRLPLAPEAAPSAPAPSAATAPAQLPTSTPGPTAPPL